jgi:Alpha-mannosidase
VVEHPGPVHRGPAEPAGRGRQLPDVRSAFELVGAHLDKARRDTDYKFVLAEIDYLKPYFDAFPQDREDLRRLMAEGRVEIVGGNYNEPNTNLISAEAIIRNAVYGIGFQRDVFGGDPRSAWMSTRSATTRATRA